MMGHGELVAQISNQISNLLYPRIPFCGARTGWRQQLSDALPIGNLRYAATAYTCAEQGDEAPREIPSRVA
jgi:hypothetical protein